MSFQTRKYNYSDLLTLNEVMFLQDLALAAGYDADNVALDSELESITPYDISSQFNGIATTFTIPTYTTIKLFIITGWPPNGVLRPTVDFTTPTSTTVSLVTSQVSAPIAGTTGIILYA